MILYENLKNQNSMNSQLLTYLIFMTIVSNILSSLSVMKIFVSTYEIPDLGNILILISPLSIGPI